METFVTRRYYCNVKQSRSASVLDYSLRDNQRYRILYRSSSRSLRVSKYYCIRSVGIFQWRGIRVARTLLLGKNNNELKSLHLGIEKVNNYRPMDAIIMRILL